MFFSRFWLCDVIEILAGSSLAHDFSCIWPQTILWDCALVYGLTIPFHEHERCYFNFDGLQQWFSFLSVRFILANGRLRNLRGMFVAAVSWGKHAVFSWRGSSRQELFNDICHDNVGIGFGPQHSYFLLFAVNLFCDSLILPRCCVFVVWFCPLDGCNWCRAEESRFQLWPETELLTTIFARSF